MMNVFVRLRTALLIALSFQPMGGSGFSSNELLFRNRDQIFASTSQQWMTTSNQFNWPDEKPSGNEGGGRRRRRRRVDRSNNSRNSKGTARSSSDYMYNYGMSELRKSRLEQDEERRKRFLSGDALHQVREKVLEMRYELEAARELRASKRVDRLEKAIMTAQDVDPEYMYKVSLERMAAAERLGLTDEAEVHRKQAMFAKQAIPQFNLEGLWVGKYGDHGFELINVTYVDDILVARKVTGDRNVPKNEISFSVDLSMKSSENSMLEPIELADDAADQWGSRFLQRFAGQGQVSSRGFVNSQWMDGQLILVGNYFSFAWLPIGHQVFFGRPSAELTLKLLRESTEKPSQNQCDEDREHLTRCLEETEMLEDEMEVSDGLFKSDEQSDYYDIPGAWE